MTSAVGERARSPRPVMSTTRRGRRTAPPGGEPERRGRGSGRPSRTRAPPIPAASGRRRWRPRPRCSPLARREADAPIPPGLGPEPSRRRAVQGRRGPRRAEGRGQPPLHEPFLGETGHRRADLERGPPRHTRRRRPRERLGQPARRPGPDRDDPPVNLDPRIALHLHDGPRLRAKGLEERNSPKLAEALRPGRGGRRADPAGSSRLGARSVRTGAGRHDGPADGWEAGCWPA